MVRRAIISPHPDDAELGLGASIWQWRQAGDHVVLYVCTGPGNFVANHGSGHLVGFEERKLEQFEAAKILGIQEVVFLNLAPASAFDTVPQNTFVKVFDKVLPGASHVYIPFPSYNIDHERVWKTVMAAFRPGALDKTNIYAYEQPGQGHADRQPWGLIQGKKYMEITPEALTMKCAALGCHVTQFASRMDTLAGKAGVEALAEQRGLEIGCPFAEVVFPIREIETRLS